MPKKYQKNRHRRRVKRWRNVRTGEVISNTEMCIIRVIRLLKKIKRSFSRPGLRFEFKK